MLDILNVMSFLDRITRNWIRTASAMKIKKLKNVIWSEFQPLILFKDIQISNVSSSWKSNPI